jgi:hypothetical protein
VAVCIWEAVCVWEAVCIWEAVYPVKTCPLSCTNGASESISWIHRPLRGQVPGVCLAG